MGKRKNKEKEKSNKSKAVPVHDTTMKRFNFDLFVIGLSSSLLQAIYLQI